MVLETTVIEQVYIYVKDHRYLGIEFIFLCTAGAIFSLFSVAFDISVDTIKFNVSQSPGFSLLLILIACILIEAFDPNMRGSGIPEMKIALSKNMNRRTEAVLNLRAFLVKSSCLLLVLVSGLPFGREGPFVHLASMAFYLLFHFFVRILSSGCLGSRLSQTIFFGRFPEFSPSMLSAACALGVACTFASPIGGVLFSIEVTNKRFKTRNYWKCCMVAVIGSIVFKLFGKETDLSKVVNETPVKLISMTRPYIYSILIGIFGAVTALAFIFLFQVFNFIIQLLPIVMDSMCRLFRRCCSWPLADGRFVPFRAVLHPNTSIWGFVVAIVKGLILVGINIFVYTCLVDTSTDNLALYLNKTDFDNQSLFVPETNLKLPNQLLLLLITKMVVAILLILLPVPCGVFLPLMVIGAVFGQYYAAVIGDPIIPASLMGVLGAASVSGAVTQTVSAAIIVVDLSNQEQCLILALLTAFVSNVIYKLLRPWNILSIYDMMANLRHMAYLPDEADEKYHTFCTVRVDSLTEPAVEISVQLKHSEPHFTNIQMETEKERPRSRHHSVNVMDPVPAKDMHIPLSHLLSHKILSSSHHFYLLMLKGPSADSCVGVVYKDDVKRYLQEVVPDIRSCVEHLEQTEWVDGIRYSGCQKCRFFPSSQDPEEPASLPSHVTLVPRELELARQRFRRRFITSSVGSKSGRQPALVYTQLCHITSWVPPYWNLLEVHDLMHERKYFQVMVSGDGPTRDVITYERVLQKIDDLHKEIRNRCRGFPHGCGHASTPPESDLLP